MIIYLNYAEEEWDSVNKFRFYGFLRRFHLNFSEGIKCWRSPCCADHPGNDGNGEILPSNYHISPHPIYITNKKQRSSSLIHELHKNSLILLRSLRIIAHSRESISPDVVGGVRMDTNPPTDWVNILGYAICTPAWTMTPHTRPYVSFSLSLPPRIYVRMYEFPDQKTLANLQLLIPHTI